MLIKHEYKKDLSHLKLEDVTKVVEEITDCLESLEEAVDSLQKLSDNEIDGETFLTYFEELVISDNMSTFLNYASSSCSIVMAINRVFSSLVNVTIEIDGKVQRIEGLIGKYDKIVNKCSSIWAEPSESEIPEIIELVKTLIGRLAYVMYYEFGIKESYQDLADGIVDYRINAAVNQATQEMSVDSEEFITGMAALHKANKPNIGIFDENPELENAFMEIVGPYLLDLSESDITLDLVMSVITGKVDPANLYEMFGGDEE